LCHFQLGLIDFQVAQRQPAKSHGRRFGRSYKSMRD